MKRFSKTILIAIIAVAGAGFLLTQNVKAVAVVDIQFQNEPLPLFHDMDTKPCDVTSRWIRVVNKSDQIQPISIQATNFTNLGPLDDLSHALSIVIKQGAADLYGGSANPKTLYDFYQAGETYLSDAGIGATIQYDITISFPCDKENEWQEKTTGFDIVIHFQGGEEQNGGGNGGPNATIVSDGGGGGNGPIGQSDAYQNWLNQQLPPGEVKGESTQNPPGMGGAEGEVKGASTFLPATGFDFNEFVILAMILLALIGLRVILKKKSAAVA